MPKNNLSILRVITQIAYLAIFIAGILKHNYVIMFITVTAILFGPIFCGWMCFVGLYQDALRYLGQKLFNKESLEPSAKVQNVLKYSRYIFLVGVISIGGIFLFPGKVWGNFAGLMKGHVEINTAFYFLILLGILSLFTKRFFCRYLCTSGAKFGLWSLLRPITINRKDSCISCQKCHLECPMGIEVNKSNSLANPSCISCLKCIETCPNNSLKIGIRNYLKP